MIIPTKHEKLTNNVVVVGADVLHAIRNEPLSLEKIYQELRKENSVKIEIVFDAILFLWLIEAINMEGNIVSKIKKS
ncbi:MAG: ABC-three component system middle component 6 [Crocinitomicaceae bacterium]